MYTQLSLEVWSAWWVHGVWPGVWVARLWIRLVLLQHGDAGLTSSCGDTRLNNAGGSRHAISPLRALDYSILT